MWRVLRGAVAENYSLNKLFETNSFGNLLREYDESCSDLVKVLFLSCTDLRNPLYCIDRPFTFKTLELHINNSSIPVIARNVLIAKILADIEKNSLDEHVLYIWDIWYNASWKISHADRFKKDLQELLDGRLPENVKIYSDNNAKCLQNLWNEWLSMISTTNIEILNNVLKQRSSFIEEQWNKTHNKGQPKIPLDQVLETLLQEMENAIAANNGKSVGEKAKEEISHFYSTGICKISEEETEYVNPTFLNCGRELWKADYSCPFECYLPLSCKSEKSLTEQCLEKLKNIFLNFLEHKDHISLYFHISDPIIFCLDNPISNFAAIYCFDVADRIGLANLLIAASRKLEHNQQAVLITDSTTWSTLSSSIVQYIENALCTPLTLIPTHYGLRLINHVQLGHSDPFDIVNMSTMPISLKWKRAEQYNNIYPAPSVSTFQMINQLKKWCFYVPEMISEPEELCGMKSYTPLTMGHVILSMAQRLKWTLEDVEKLLPSEIDERFNLSMELLKAWLGRAPLIRLFSNVSITSNHLPDFTCEDFPYLRILICDLRTSREFYLDNNIQFGYHQDRSGSLEAASLHFILPRDHNLDPDSTVTLMSIKSSSSFLFGPLTNFQEEQIENDSIGFSAFSSQSSIQTQSLTDRCVEFDDRYEVDFTCRQEDSESLKLSINISEVPPHCECGHKVDVRISDSTRTLVFPWPVQISAIQTLPLEDDNRRRAILKKSLTEPWPCEWLNPFRWDTEQLKPWDSLFTQQDLSVHLSSQFYFRDLQDTLGADNNDLPTGSTALREVRCTIQSLFVRSLIDGHSYFAVRDDRWPDQSPDWFLRVHLPIRISPSGSPILLLSSYDQQTARKLHQHGRMDFQTSIEQMKRVLDIQPSTEVVTVLTYTDEEAKLLRYVLRLNSTKILPTPWQKENFSHEEDGPWLATFLSPLYVDHPGLYPAVKDLIGTFQSVSNESLSSESVREQHSVESRKICATCKKEEIEMKRCGRCKIVFYCSVQCQRNDWRSHKLICSS